jgi:basic amino acid/polyamine antiporter, APA family
MAKDGLFFKSVAKIHPKFDVPSNSILLQGLIAVVLALSGTFEQVLTYMGFALGIFPLLTIFGVFKLRRTHPEAMRIKGYPITQIIYLLAGAMILVLAFMERPKESSVALLTVLVGIPAYFIFKKKNGEEFTTKDTKEEKR